MFNYTIFYNYSFLITRYVSVTKSTTARNVITFPNSEWWKKKIKYAKQKKFNLSQSIFFDNNMVILVRDDN